MRWVMIGLAGAIAPMLPTPAAAQSGPAEPPATTPASSVGSQPAADPGRTAGQQVYQAAYFAQFAPSTALQIVQRVPGFTLDAGDSTVRGFAGAAGNVVINGQRPSSKSDTLDIVLARIPANRVLRVEIGRGDLYGTDYSSKSQVLNLVLSNAGGVAGTVEVAARREFTGKIKPEGNASALIRRGPSTFNVAASFVNEQTTEEGIDRVTALPSGAPVEFRRKVNSIAEPTLSGSLGWDYNGGANHTAHLNGSILHDRFALTQQNHVEPVGDTVRDDLLTQRYHYNNYEVGGDVTRPFAGGGLKLVALATWHGRDLYDASYNRVTGATIGGFTQTLHDELDERLARLVWSRPDLGGWSVEAGAEGALNRLDSRVDLFALGAAGAPPTRVVLPIEHAVVKELRGEAFVNAGKGVTSKLHADIGLSYEASHLTVSGDAQADRTLTFLKPKATLDWKISPKWHGQLSIQRTVAQLQFADFIGSAELSNGRINGSNAELVPQRAWEVLATIERPILGDGLVKLELGYNQVSMVQDRVPTDAGLDAPGNLGNGTVFIARPRIELPLARAGIPGGRLTFYVSYVKTSVRDPYTLGYRPFSGNNPIYAEVIFRQDLKRFAWGVTAEANGTTTYYRLDELDATHADIPRITAFAEWRPTARTSLNLTFNNLFDRDSYRNRTFFTPDRRTPDPYLREYRVRNQHVVTALTLKHSFG